MTSGNGVIRVKGYMVGTGVGRKNRRHVSAVTNGVTIPLTSAPLIYGFNIIRTPLSTVLKGPPVSLKILISAQYMDAVISSCDALEPKLLKSCIVIVISKLC